MSELQPLDIIDDRTLEQIRTDGDDRWPSGDPYIVRGVCAVCGAEASQDHDCLVMLAEPDECELFFCGNPAHWRLNGMSLCDKDILDIAGMKSDNEQWLAPALADIAARKADEG